MHEMVFQAKRLHLRSLAIGRAAMRLQREELSEADAAAVAHVTPARFDILFLLSKGDSRKRAWPWQQSALVRWLHLHASTVSRMLDRLADLRFVRKAKVETDRRRNEWSLTRLGWRAMQLALSILRKDRPHERRFTQHFGRRWRGALLVGTSGLARAERHAGRTACFAAGLRRLARTLGSESLLRYRSTELQARELPAQLGRSAALRVRRAAGGKKREPSAAHRADA